MGHPCRQTAALALSLAALALAAATSGCRSGVSVVGTPEDGGVLPQGAPVSLRLDGVRADLPLEVGSVVDLKAFAKFSDGTEVDFTAQATFTSNGPAAKVAGHTLTAALVGKAEVRATYAGDAGAALTDAVTVTVQNQGAGVTVALEVTPPRLSLSPGLGAQLRANATQADSSQRNATGLATWTSRNPTVCTVDDSARKGFVSAVAAGACVVDATYGGQTGSAQISVDDLTVKDLSVSPVVLLVPKGGTGQLLATATLSDGSAVDATRTATWTSDDATIATVASGLVSGLATGATNVSASLGGITAKVAVKVDAAPLVSISVTPPQATLAAGLTQNLRATAVYGDGVSIDVTQQADWSVDKPAIATVTTRGNPGAGQVSGVAVGRAIVKASYGGLAGSAIITVSDAQLQSLTLVPAASTLPAGTSVRLRAFGSYSDHSVREVSTSATWSVGDPQLATVDATGLVTGLAKGTTKVSAQVGGVSAVAVIEVTDAQLSKILLLPVSVVVPMGLSQRVFATGIYSDNSLHDVTEQATWNVAQGAIATVSNSAGQRGTITGVSAGDTTVTATLGAVTSAPTGVTVSGAALISIALQSPTPLLPVYLTVPYRVQARYSDGSQFDQTTNSTFSVDNPAVASVVATGPSAGLVTALSQGRVQIKATLGGLSATQNLQVVDAVLTGIVVRFPKDLIKVGEAEQVRCLAQYQGAPQPIDVTPLCTFTSGDPTVARFLVNPAGTITGQAPGKTTLYAELNGTSGSRPLAVDSQLPLKIIVQEPAVTLAVAVTRALIAIGYYADNTSADITLGADWSSDNNSAAVVGNTGLIKGFVTGVAIGDAKITAKQGAAAGYSAVTVGGGKAVKLSIAPVNPVVTVRAGGPGPGGGGVQLPFYATATFDDGTDQNVTEASSWTTSDPTIVTISDQTGSKGRAVVTNAGGATVTASFRGLTASTFLTAR
jgi:hypothetical protein